MKNTLVSRAVVGPAVGIIPNNSPYITPHKITKNSFMYQLIDINCCSEKPKIIIKFFSVAY